MKKKTTSIYIPVDTYFTPAIRCWKIVKMTLKSAWKVLDFDLEKCVRTLIVRTFYFGLIVCLELWSSCSYIHHSLHANLTVVQRKSIYTCHLSLQHLSFCQYLFSELSNICALSALFVSVQHTLNFVAHHSPHGGLWVRIARGACWLHILNINFTWSCSRMLIVW